MTGLRSPSPRIRVRRPGAPRPLDPEARRCLAVGAVLALILVVVPLLRFVFSYLAILAHELGHTLAYWLFGYPAFPAFDFLYGGGVTFTPGRSLLLLLALYAVAAAGLARLRRHRRLLTAAAALLAAHVLLSVTPLHQAVISFAGHGGELLLAGIFLGRALSGRAVTGAVERHLYAAFGLFLVLGNLLQTWGLMTSAGERLAYSEAKGGHLRGDLEVLAQDFLGGSVRTPALLLFLLSAATPFLVWWIWRRGPALRERAHTWLRGG